MTTNTQTQSVSNYEQMIAIDESIQGMFNSGDAVLIDTSVRTFEFDGVYAFRVGESKFITRLQFIPNKGIRVLSEKEGDQDWTITKDMYFKVMGRVIKGWKGQNV